MRITRVLAGLLAGVLAVPAGSSLAATFTWDGGNASGHWSLGGAGGNWSGDPAPAAGGAADADLVFASNLNAQLSTNNLNGFFRLNAMTFGSGLPEFAVSGGILSNAAALTQHSANPVALRNAIKYGIMTVDGSGTGRLTLAGSVTAINSNVTRVVTVSGDHDVEFTGIFSGNGTPAAGFETILTNNLAPGRTLTFSGSFRLTDNVNTRDLQLAGSGDTVFSGTLASYAGGIGDNTLEIANTGTTRIVGTNAALKNVTLAGSGTLQVSGTYPVGSGTLTFSGPKLMELIGSTALSNVTVGLNTFTTAGANTLEIRGLLLSSHSGTNRLTFNNPLSILSGGVNMSSGGPSKRWFEFAGTGSVYVPSVVTRGAAGSVDVTINSSGAVTFAAANTYIGNTTVAAGALRVENASGSGTGTGNVTVRSNAVVSGSGLIQGHLTLNPGARFEAGVNRPLTVSNLVVGAACTLSVTNSGAGPIIYYTGSAPTAFANVLGLNGRQVSYDTAGVVAITGSEHPGAIISIQ